MTPADLMAIHPLDLQRLTDVELGERLASIIPAARAEFIGRTEPAIITADGLKISERTLNRDIDMLSRYLNGQGLANPLEVNNAPANGVIAAPANLPSAGTMPTIAATKRQRKQPPTFNIT